MKRGLSLHIGVNVTDPESYGSTRNRRLYGCVNDAVSMFRLASINGFTPMALLVDEYATFPLVEGYMRVAARQLREGETFMVTFSGHGMSLPAGDPDDGFTDESIVLYDQVMKDNYINVLLRRFRRGCRVILVADSCHSATIFKLGSKASKPVEADARSEREDREHRGPRVVFASAALEHWERARNIYDDLDERFAREDRETPMDIMADTVVLSACQDNELAHDGPDHGKFTEAMLRVLGKDMRGFTGSYKELVEKIHFAIANEQRPQATLLGPNADKASYKFFQGPVFSL